MSEGEDRNKLLLQMYDQMFNDIDAHLKVVWQSIAVMVGAFAIFSLVEKKVISVDVASTLIVVIAGWLLANLIDAGYWYNRNLVIIANIEREFLHETDLRHIHYYFGKHRPDNKMFTHLRIQFFFGTVIGIVAILWHLVERILPLPHCPCVLDLTKALPYVVAFAVMLYLIWLRSSVDRKYAEFVKNSPGKKISAHGVDYGEGHGFPRAEHSKSESESEGPAK